MQKPKLSSTTEVRGGFSVPEARSLCSPFWQFHQLPAKPAGAKTFPILALKLLTQGRERWACSRAHSFWHKLLCFLSGTWVSFSPAELRDQTVKEPSLISACSFSFPCLHPQLFFLPSKRIFLKNYIFFASKQPICRCLPLPVALEF